MVFEYGIISRWYGFFVLLVFIITYLLTREKKNYILISLLLIVLANHTISTAIFAASLTIYTIIHIINEFQAKIISSEDKRKIIISSTILVVGSILIIYYNFLYLLLNHVGNQFEQWGYPPFFMTLRTIWSSYIPIPDFSNGAAFWNTNIFPFPIYYPHNYDPSFFITTTNIFAVTISVIFIIICLIIFSRKPPVLLTFIINTSIYFVFIHYIFRGHFIRHLALLFIIFVYCAWLYKYSDDHINLPGFKSSKLIRGFSESKFVKILFASFVTIIFFFQFLAGVLTYPKSIKYQFTKSWDTANYIKSNNYDEYILVGAIDFAVQPIAAILKRDIYFPQTNKFSKTVDYGINRDNNVNLNKLFRDSAHYLNTYNKKILIILNSELKDKNGISVNVVKFSNNILLRKLVSFEGDIIQRDEQYYLYELTKTD
jgi:hypothetical protein